MRARRSGSPSALPSNQHRLPRQHTFRSESGTLAHPRDGVARVIGGISSGRNWGARIREYESEGMRLVFLENEAIRIGIKAHRGSDAFERGYKPSTITLAPRFADAYRP